MRAPLAFVSTALVFGGLVVVAACSSDRETFGATDDGGGADAAPRFEGDSSTKVAVTFKGTVFAPNGELPMANTLVYYTLEKPADIPEGAYCDSCVALPEKTFAVSGANGEFEIASQVSVGKVFIVTQKGQFRRVREVEVKKAGEIELDQEDTTLPGRSNPGKGDTVPSMVILKGTPDYDKIDQSLNKLGIEDIEIKTDRSMLEDLDELMKHQIIFLPCATQSDPKVKSATALENMRAFVAAGGKVYVTDYSYEFVRQPFPGYISWQGETPTIGSAVQPLWSAPATAADEGLGAWLAATGDSNFEVEGNYTIIKSVNTTTGLDPEGNQVDVTPKVWMTAKKGPVETPTTISFENQCGRVLFSTYHTEASFGGTELHAQEKALLYVLLEVGVCVGEQPGVK